MYMKAAVLKLLVLFHLPRCCVGFLKKWPAHLDRRRWGEIKMPPIKEVFPSLITMDFVSVQPMATLPSGAVFHLDFKYMVPTYDPNEKFIQKAKTSYESDKPIVIFLKQHE